MWYNFGWGMRLRYYKIGPWKLGDEINSQRECGDYWDASGRFFSGDQFTPNCELAPDGAYMEITRETLINWELINTRREHLGGRRGREPGAIDIFRRQIKSLLVYYWKHREPDNLLHFLLTRLSDIFISCEKLPAFLQRAQSISRWN